MFFIHSGLVSNNVVEQFSVGYFALIIPLILVQAKTIMFTLAMDNKLIKRSPKEKKAISSPGQA
jgi:hypothetical protein